MYIFTKVWRGVFLGTRSSLLFVVLFVVTFLTWLQQVLTILFVTIGETIIPQIFLFIVAYLCTPLSLLPSLIFLILPLRLGFFIIGLFVVVWFATLTQSLIFV